jgi:hypothetical protein
VDNSAPSATRPLSTYKSGKAVQASGATSLHTVESNRFAKLFAAERRTRPFGFEQLSSSWQDSRASLGSQTALRPNPSLERTSTGWARYARWSFSASRAQPVASAQLKR